MKFQRKNSSHEEDYDEEDYDEEDEDDEDEDEGYDGEEDDEEEAELAEAEKRHKRIRALIIGGIVLCLLVILVALRMTGNQKEDTPPAEPQKTEQVEEKKVTDPTEKKKKPVEKKAKSAEAYEAEAKHSLERENAPLPDGEAKPIAEAIKAATDKMKEHPKETKNDQASGLFFTNDTMLNNLRSLILMHYTPDLNSVKAYKSDSDQVTQFTVRFKKDGKADVTLTGNWSPKLKQLGFAQLHGDFEPGSYSDHPSEQSKA